MTPLITERSWVRRLGWFLLLWSAGVVTVGAVALILRLPLLLLK